jgi:hypothetical protein
MAEFIYITNNSLSNDFCNQIILNVNTQISKNDFSENDFYKIQKIELIIHKDEQEIQKYLIEEIGKHLNIYLSYLKQFYNIILSQKFCINSITIFKMINNVGFIPYQNNDWGDLITATNSMIEKQNIFTFMWFLNDDFENGETVFLNDNVIKAEKGKLVVFPSEWFIPNKSNIPIGNDKYILICWIYVDIFLDSIKSVV